jgi:hypothetical protein
VIAHGQATIIAADDPEFATLDATQVECGGDSVREWSGRGLYLRLDAERLYTYTSAPER